jgi:hypothetical protein
VARPSAGMARRAARFAAMTSASIQPGRRVSAWCPRAPVSESG